MVRAYLMRNLHASWQIAVASCAVFIGIVLAPSIPWQLTAISWFLTGVTLILFAVMRQKVWVVMLAVVGGCLIGVWRGQVEQSSLEAYEGLYDTTIEFSGVVAEDSDVDKQGNTTVRLRDVAYRGRSLPGKVWVSLAEKASIERSDTVAIKGTVEKGFGTFVASVYRAEVIRITRPQPGDIALHVRDWFANAVRHAVPEPEASLGVGYLVGQRRSLPETLDVALQTAGLTHIVVASGYNLTILVRLARRLFARVSKYLSALVSTGLIMSFIAVTGMSPSMSRAGLVAGLSLLAWYYGRKVHPIILLSFAVAVTVLINPSYAWGDVGWQLSFAAFGGVMILAPLLQAYFFGNAKPGITRQILGETISAWLCTLPILLYSFGYLSNVAIIANLLILPLVPLAMLLTFIAGVGSIMFTPFALAIGVPAYALLHYMTSIATHISLLPWAKTEVSISGWCVIAMYAGIVLFACYLWWKTRLDLSQQSIVE